MATLKSDGFTAEEIEIMVNAKKCILLHWMKTITWSVQNGSVVVNAIRWYPEGHGVFDRKSYKQHQLI